MAYLFTFVSYQPVVQLKLLKAWQLASQRGLWKLPVLFKALIQSQNFIYATFHQLKKEKKNHKPSPYLGEEEIQSISSHQEWHLYTWREKLMAAIFGDYFPHYQSGSSTRVETVVCFVHYHVSLVSRIMPGT